MGFIKNHFRRRYLKKQASTVPTRFLPLNEIKSAVILINVEDNSFDECREKVLAFFREHNIRCEIFFFDLRRIDSCERLITSITNTILRKDLNWIGRPAKDKLKIMEDLKADLIVSLIDNTGFPVECMAKCCTATFKIGRVQLPGDTFNIVVSDPPATSYRESEVFDLVKSILVKIS